MDLSIGPWQIGNGRHSTPGRSGASATGGPLGWLDTMLGGTQTPRRTQTGVSPVLAWWSGLSRSERLTTLSIVVGGAVAIVCSLAWALALSYIAHQNAKASLMEDELYSIEAGELPEEFANQEDATVGGWQR